MFSLNKSTPLAAVWSQVTALLESGYSLIPVRDKEEGGKPAKSPFTGWKKYQSQIISQAELWEQMEKFNTSAVAVICGKVSGNLEVIDIDVKYKPGIDARVFGDIKTLYPELWRRLRLHRSQSGGFHIPYKIIDQPPAGNQKLASRPTTPEENTRTKNLSFIETRGEGGYVVIPPSLGYSIYKAEPVPLLTWEERCSLINLCVAYNEVIKIEPQPKGNKFENDYYDENPFEHFNKSDSGAKVLLEFGWKKLPSENSSFTWYNRPGSKSKERHATFIKSKNLFYFWSTNTEFEPQKCYHPATVFTMLNNGGDYKLSYKELVKRGFGKIRASKEAKIIKLAKQLPANISPESKAAHEELIRERSELHPYGTFWQVSPEGDRVAIDREGVYRIAHELGFRLYRGAVLRLIGKLLFKVEERAFQDEIKAYIREKDLELRLLILNTYEAFLQVAGKFTLTRLPLLDESKLMTDTSTTCYKFFRDCWIRITATTIEQYTWEEMPGYILAEKFLDRDLLLGEGGRYVDFLEKAVEYKKLKEHVLRVIGYLAHDYKDETTAYIIVLTEQCPDPKQGGGSGKNLFCNLFKHITSISSRPGEQIKYDASFFQSWNGERVYVISDAPKDFKFIFLKDMSSGTAILKKLFKDERVMENTELPKIIVNTNYSYEILDGGLKRRIIPLEFTDFFTKSNGVRVHYGAHFPTEWTADDWAGYNHTMIRGIQAWLDTRLILEAPSLTAGGWRKQFEQAFGYSTADFIYENFDSWVESIDKFVGNPEFKSQMDAYFSDKGVSKIYHPSIHKVNKAVEEYAHRMGWDVDTNYASRANGILTKGKKFSKRDIIAEEEPPF